MSPLKKIIIDEINQRGPMRIDRYMQLCLAHPQYGYYMKHDPFGTDGDFTTAPEISQIFGEMIGLWCINAWEQAGKPKDCALIELGPGRGTLMADLLRTISKVSDFKPEIHLVEISPVLRAAQKLKLKNYKVEWHDEFPILKKSTFLIANEFFDALPIRQFVGDKERMIIADGENLAFNLPAEEGLVKEICEPAQATIEKISKNSVAGVIIDYGYIHSNKSDSLQAVKQHKYVSALEDPGNADLTIHVDFAELTKFLKKPSSLYSQREFLLRHGADVRAKILNRESDLQRLIDPEQMGELFKVLCF